MFSSMHADVLKELQLIGLPCRQKQGDVSEQVCSYISVTPDSNWV